MKYSKIIFGLLIIFLSSCTNESNNNYRLSFDSAFPQLTLIDDKGNEIISMNFRDDGTLIAFEVTDRDRAFSVIFNFDADSINSYVINDERSKYGNSTLFYPNEESKLRRIEAFDKLIVSELILNDGNVIMQTSNVDDYMEEW